MMMQGESSRKKRDNDPGLTDIVFSWSLDDIFNENLFKNKVEKIPESFQSVKHYLDSYSTPLLEETRAQLYSSMQVISRAPFAEVVALDESMPYGKKLYDVKVDYWRNRFCDRGKEPYKTLPGDVLVLADAKPETASDLQRIGRTWTFVLVNKITEDENDDDNTSTYFKVKALKDKDISDEIQKSLFVIFLINIIPNKRIWNSLHMSRNLKIIKEVLCTNSVVEENCEHCPVQSDDLWDEKFCRNLSSALNESQREAVSVGLHKMHCDRKSSVELIWGPPGTGKTKTVSMLLFTLLRMKCRTLICAPTNVAITEVASRVLKLVKELFETDSGTDTLFCSLGDILLFGNKERLKVGSEIEEIYLDYRVKRLTECFGPLTGWRHCLASMLDFLEDGVSHYHKFLENELVKEREHIKDNKTKIKEKQCMNKTECSKGKHKCFLEFARDRFASTVKPLRYCVPIFCTHIPKNYIMEHNFQNMVSLIDLLDSFETLLFRNDVVSEELEELFSHSVDEDYAQSFGDTQCLLYTRRHECLSVLRIIQVSLKNIDLPSVMNKGSITDFCFQTASLIFCTASSSYKLHSVAMKPLNLLVIDEAAQLKECESIIPLQLPGLKHAILIGDVCQLPAMVESRVSGEAGFGRSLFERLSSLGHSKLQLNIQYRMHPSISSFPNSNFYHGIILDAPNVKKKNYSKKYLPWPMFGPYSFINIIGGREEFDDNGRSRKNMVEVSVVLKILRNLYKAWIGSKQKLSVGVISPYNAQVAAIQEKLERKYENLDGFVVKVKSIDGFQGGEEDIILISSVRSTPGIEFISNPQRTNVALTRARHCLWILGNERTLANSESVWETLIRDAKNRQCFFNAHEDKDLAKAILEVKKEFDQLDDLLNGDSVLFKSARWKVLFSDNFLKSFKKLTPVQKKKSVLNLLLKLASGWRPKKWKVDAVCGSTSQIFKKFKVEGVLYIVCTIDIVKEDKYIQVLKVWDILPLEDIPKLEKRLDGIFGKYTDDFISHCKEKCIEGGLEVPKTWPPSSEIVRLKDLSSIETGNDLSGATSDGRSYVENSKVSESLSIMKFYALSSGIVSHLLSDRDGRELDLPFEVTDQELEIIIFPRSTFVLGRSGTGKTTILTMKLFKKEEQYHNAMERFYGVDSNSLPCGSHKDEVREGIGERKGAVLRQLFVTVSPKLCYAVKRHISDLKRSACGGTSSEESSSIDEDDIDDISQFSDIPDSFVDLPARSFPIVVTFYKFLMMLNGTVGSSFFEKFAEVRGLSHGQKRSSKSLALQTFIRTKEVSYERFSTSYWPHFSVELTRELDSSTVFTEIMSHIKGQLKTGETYDSLLSREDYILLSEGRISTLGQHERERIYDIFLQYEKKKMRSGEFDLADLVNDLHRRLRNERYEGGKIDFVYIDEVQDLTMRQVALFKYVCRNFEEGFVFAGDTAQTIARGIDFRFQDIRSLYYKEFVQETRNVKTYGRKEKGQKTDFFHLSQNFRTHDGVLKLAQSVVDLLYHFFPISIDILSPEASLIYGEAPVMLQVNDEDAFFNIFRSVGSFGRGLVGFGAEQVILVRDDCVRNAIFDKVGKQALVLTIVECKGLEFQDVILYNFFGSSPLKNQWRVIYEYMKNQNLLDSTSPRSFPCFNKEKHTILCAELKQLYVAITRTKQRLWIFENEHEPSKPMFDYWNKLCLVQVQQLDGALVQEMQVASNQEEWKSRGIKLFHQHNYEMARMCFDRAGETYWEKWAEAAGLRSAADRMRSSNPKTARTYLTKAAQIYDSIDKAESAAQCFFELNEYEKAGTIYLEKCRDSKLEEAGECFSLAGCYERAAQVYARGNFFSKCLSVCADGKLFEMGLQYIHSWKLNATSNEAMLIKRNESDKISQGFLERVALHYHKLKDHRSMMKFVEAFCSENIIRTFLKNIDCLDELLLLEIEWGNFLEAANIAKLKGDLLLEADMLEKAGHFEKTTMLILRYVFSNSLWAPGSEGWPLKHFMQKNELLMKAKTLAKNVSDHFHEFVCTETKVLSDEQGSVFKMKQYFSDSRRVSVRSEILCARKILDAHLHTSTSEYEWKDGSLSDVETLVYFWNFWKENIVKIFEYLGSLKTQDAHGEFCLSYLSVRMHIIDTNTIFHLLNPEANWLREIDFRCLKRKGNIVSIDAQQFVNAAKSYWSSEILSVGKTVLQYLKAIHDYSIDNTPSLYCQSLLLIHMFEVTKFLMESEDRRYCNSVLQRYLELSVENFFANIYPVDCRKSLMEENMIFLRQRGSSRNLIKEVIYRNIRSKSKLTKLTYGQIGKVLTAMLGSGKLFGRLYEQTAERFNNNLPWRACIDNFVRNRGQYFPPGSQLLQGSAPNNFTEAPIEVSLFLKALEDTYNADWENENDYISPDCFLYLVERFLILVFCSKGCLFTTTSSFVEWLIFHEWNTKSVLNFAAVSQSSFEESLDFIIKVVKQLLYNEQDTLNWIERSKMNSDCYPMVVLRLFIIMCLVCLNTLEYFGLLFDLLCRREISSLLPWKFYDTLRKQWKHDCVDTNLNVLAEAFKKIGNPLVGVGLGGNFPKFPDVTFVNLKFDQRRKHILNVLCLKNIKTSTYQTGGVKLGAKKSVSSGLSYKSNGQGESSNLSSSNFTFIVDQKKSQNEDGVTDPWRNYLRFWDALKSLDNGNRVCFIIIMNHASWFKEEILKIILLITAAMKQRHQSTLFDIGEHFEETNRILDELQQLYSALDSSGVRETKSTIGELVKSLLSRRPLMEVLLNLLAVQNNTNVEGEETLETNVSSGAQCNKEDDNINADKNSGDVKDLNTTFSPGIGGESNNQFQNQKQQQEGNQQAQDRK